jgi:hypothetical protein
MTRPTSTERRVENYRRQTRRPALTPRQRRRVDKKEGVLRKRQSARS